MKNYYKFIEHHESLEIAGFSCSEMLVILLLKIIISLDVTLGIRCSESMKKLIILYLNRI